MMQVKSMIPELQERELHESCNFPFSVDAFLPVYDGKEHYSWGKGAEVPGDFSDSVAAGTSD
jgi:hypothetical protein